MNLLVKAKVNIRFLPYFNNKLGPQKNLFLLYDFCQESRYFPYLFNNNYFQLPICRDYNLYIFCCVLS